MSTSAQITYAEAIRRALEAAMAQDDAIILLGQDTALGFPFGVTRGLVDRFGSARVRDTPISKQERWAAASALPYTDRPVVEVDFSGFLLLGLDQLVNNAAKLRYMSGGQLRVPLVVRAGQGPMGSFGAQHSQALQGWLANVPGLAVCTPASPQEAYDMMRWSLRQSDPVIFCEDMRLYRTKGTVEVHEEQVELGARIVRRGSDLTVIAYGHGVGMALDVAAELSSEGMELEVLDLRSVSPLDVAAIGASARRTGRAICVSDDPLLGGFSATLAATATEQARRALRAPVVRLAGRHAPAPYNADLERTVFPSHASLASAARALVAWEDDS